MATKKLPAYSFVLDELAESAIAPKVRVRPMFGSHSVYIDEKIIFILRRKQTPESLVDDGIWIAMQPEHNSSLQREFPSLRRIAMFAGRAFSGWLNLPEREEGFEEAALRVCRMVIDGDSRIGKIPPAKKRKKGT